MSESKTGEISELQINSPESWENAKAYAAIMGAVPASFSATIRMLVIGHLKNEDSWKARFQVIRLLNGPTMKSIFYHAAKTFRSKELEQNPKMGVRELVQLFKPLDLAGLLAVIYLYRRSHKIISKKESFAELSAQLCAEADIGGHLGDAIPSIGFGTGLLIGSIRYLALAPFINHDEDGYNRYLRHLKRQEGASLDLIYEASRWNCTSLQVASILLQSTGFGVEVAQGVVNGLDPRLTIHDVPDKDQYRVKITKVWIDSLKTTGEQPNLKMRGEFYPLKDALDLLQAQSSEIRSSGSKYSWLTRGKDDLKEEDYPHLYPKKKEGASEAAPAAAQAQEKVPVTYPNELLEFFSEAELQQMTQAQIDEMVKQVEIG